jgi:hypothetical protein
VVARGRGPRPLTPRLYALRLLRHLGYSLGVVAVSLLLGTLGFMQFCKLAVVDAFLNASMLLGGMGPIGDLGAGGTTGKLFASFFSLYSGLVFLIAGGLLLTPMFHHVLRVFHWEDDDP